MIEWIIAVVLIGYGAALAVAFIVEAMRDE